MRCNLELFYIFFKIGLFTFGGGYAMIPQLKEIVVEKKKWITEDEMLEIIAIAESTPGPIAINIATFIGYKQKKVLREFIFYHWCNFTFFYHYFHYFIIL